MTPVPITALEIAAPLLDAPHEPAAWNAAFDALRAAVPCDLAGLMHAAPGQKAPPLSLVVGTDDSLGTEYVRDFQRIDPYQSADARGLHRRLREPLFSEQIVSEAELLGSAFYNDYLRPRGDLFHGIGSIRELRDGGELHFGILRRRGWRFEERERRLCGDVLRLAGPALVQRELVLRLERERAFGLGMVENCGDALFLLDADCRVEYLNAAAQGWVERDAVLFLQDGRLLLRNTEDNQWLQRETRALLPSRVVNGVDSLRLRNLDAGSHAARLYAVLSRLPVLRSPSGRLQPARVALYLRCLEDAIPQLPAPVVAELFGLTTSEARVLNALLVGISVEQMASAWGIRGDTVRGHLKRMLSKTGCARQQDLVQLATKALPHLALINDPAPP